MFGSVFGVDEGQHAAQYVVFFAEVMLERSRCMGDDQDEEAKVENRMHVLQKITHLLILADQIG